MASYGESTRLWSGAEAAGFAKIFGVPQMVALKARPEQL
jgi:argininosuccinate synthase